MIKIVLATLLLTSCTSLQKTVVESKNHYFVISYANVNKQFDNQSDVDLSYFQIAGTDIYASNFGPITNDQAQRTIEKKKKSFLSFFQNDIIPYTGTEKNRTQCLIKESSDRVEFFSGPDNQWAECSALAPIKVRAFRIWKSCFQTLWQITIKTVNVSDFKFLCE